MQLKFNNSQILATNYAAIQHQVSALIHACMHACARALQKLQGYFYPMWFTSVAPDHCMVKPTN